jgi:large subunit ribosomal protein L4
MKTVPVYRRDGSEAGTIELPDAIFGIKPSMTVLYQVMKAHLANRRQGNASSKTRSEVDVTKAKPFRQKGTGRARAGSANSPLWEKVSKKLRHLGLKSAYSIKATEDRIKVVEDFTVTEPKTKEMATILKALKINGEKALVLIGNRDENLILSSRNIPTMNLMIVENTNTYDVMHSDVLLFTKSAVDKVSHLLG